MLYAIAFLENVVVEEKYLLFILCITSFVRLFDTSSQQCGGSVVYRNIESCLLKAKKFGHLS